MLGVGFLAACSPRRPVAAPDALVDTLPTGPTALARPASPQTFVFRCADGFVFVARIVDGRAWVFLPQGGVGLPQVPTASGAQYSDGSVAFWTKGQEARLEENGTIHRDCRNDPARAVWERAKLAGVDFRAVGHEPGWVLEIVQRSEIVLITDYGTHRYAFPLPAVSTDCVTRTTRYETRRAGHDLTLLLHAGPCRDAMTGESFETSVTVILDGRTLHGCGRPLH